MLSISDRNKAFEVEVKVKINNFPKLGEEGVHRFNLFLHFRLINLRSVENVSSFLQKVGICQFECNLVVSNTNIKGYLEVKHLKLHRSHQE